MNKNTSLRQTEPKDWQTDRPVGTFACATIPIEYYDNIPNFYLKRSQIRKKHSFFLLH